MKIIMKKLLSILALLVFVIPSVSSAAALTQQQADSLIAVVQSSPGTPASAFVSLITAFSNITTAQASSLITVVQAAPGVPSNAFVNLLTSFTVDIVATQPATVPVVTPTITTQPVPQPTQQQNTTQATNTPSVPVAPVVVTPVAQPAVMDTSKLKVYLLSIDTISGNIVLRVYTNKELDWSKTVLSQGSITNREQAPNIGLHTKGMTHDSTPENPSYGYEVILDGVVIDDRVSVTIQDMSGNTFTKSIIVE